MPTGTITFLFTDIEGSTRLWQQDEAAMGAAVARHDELVREAVAAHGGEVFSTSGDGLAVAFPSASSAVAAALAAQQSLGEELWPTASPVRVRMGLHTGEAERRRCDYFGTAVNRAARLMAVGHGGQVLCSAATAGIIEAEVPLVDLGEHRLRDLDRPMHIFQLGDGRFPPLRSLDVFAGNLPVQPTRFVGRTGELSRIGAALAQSRLVTLTGVGGVGKTRLALQLAAEQSPAFADGVWLVELASLIDEALVPASVADVLGVQARAGGSVEDCLAEAFSAQAMLVVLDNCEHVIATAAALASRLVSCTGTSRVLATSREGLGVPGERVIAVPPMAVPADDTPGQVLGSDAVRLFVERAADARDGFSVTDADAPTLAELCRRLDGIPLAIELAAARVRSSAPADVLAHLDQRFRVLAAGRRTGPTRQQTLRNAIDWSHELLGEPERILLRRLSVFAGGFDLAAVEEIVTGPTLEVMDVADLLDRLVDKSLVALDLSGGATRYRLLESIRDYAFERLGEVGETAEFAARHAECFAGFAERAGIGLRGSEEGVWATRVDVEMENLRLALARAIDAGEADVALGVVGGLTLFGYGVGCPFGDKALEAAELEGAQGHRLRPLALSSAAHTALRRGEYERATTLAEAALVEARGQAESQESLRLLGEVLDGLGMVCLLRPGLSERALTVWQERRAVAVELDDPYQMLQSLLGWAGLHGDVEAAEEALRLAAVVANPSMRSYALTVLALLVTRADPARARALLDEAAQVAAGVGNREATAVAQEFLANVLDTLGDNLNAARMRLTSAEQLFASGDRNYAYLNLFGVAENLNDVGDREAALILGAWTWRRLTTPGSAGAPPVFVAAGFDSEQMSRNPAYAHTSEFGQVVRGELARLEPLVADMTHRDALVLARDHIRRQELLAGIESEATEADAGKT
jgi:predicted ATPase/class 3 adenylate cyclase